MSEKKNLTKLYRYYILNKLIKLLIIFFKLVMIFTIIIYENSIGNLSLIISK